MPRGVKRPPDNYESVIDRESVINGSWPYPVLSQPDCMMVWLELEERGLSARQIADRLHVSSRTVVRWRKRKREGGQRK
jgi:transposase-like protein